MAGVKAIDCSAAGRTVREAVFEEIDPDDARMLEEPVPVLVANPLELMVATWGALETQVEVLVTF